MKNEEKWRPTKYIIKAGQLHASPDLSEVSAGSRLVANLVAKYFWRYLPLHAHGRLIDLGCGKVPLYLAYKNFVTEIVCADWESSRHNSSHIDVVCDLNKPLPVAEQSFDTIILSDVLEHIAEPKILIHEMERILKPGGVVLLSVPFLYPIHEAPHDYYRYTEFALRMLLKQARFEILLIEAYGGSLEIWIDFFSKHLQFFPIIGKALCKALFYFASAFSESRLGERLRAETSAHFPIGYFVIAAKAT
jgi:SAM-dependent methyltransferase